MNESSSKQTIINLLKELVNKKIKDFKYEKALSLIKLIGTLLYELNQYYMDSELEDNLMILSNILLKTHTDFITNQDTILILMVLV